MDQSPLQSLSTTALPLQSVSSPSADPSVSSQPSEFTGILSQSVGDLASAVNPLSGVVQGQVPETGIPAVSLAANLRQELPHSGSLRSSNQSQTDTANLPANHIQSILSEYDLQPHEWVAGTGEDTGTGDGLLLTDSSDLNALAEQTRPETVAGAVVSPGLPITEQTRSQTLLADSARSPGLLSEQTLSPTLPIESARSSSLLSVPFRADLQGQQVIRLIQADTGRSKTSVTSSAQLQVLQGSQDIAPIKSGLDSSLFNNPDNNSLFNSAQSGGASDKNTDFSSLLDKGVILASKGASPGQLHLPSDAAVRSNIDSLKQTAEFFQLKQDVSHPGWKQEFGDKMMMMTRDGVQSATLRLNPAHLGAIDVKIIIQNDQANISFTTHQGAVKDLIDATLPRLREMMQESGVKLENASVSDHSRDQGQRQDAHGLAKGHDRNHAFYQIPDENIQVALPFSYHAPLIPQGVDFFA